MCCCSGPSCEEDAPRRGDGDVGCALGHRTMFTRAAGLVALFSKALDKNHLKERLMLLTQPTLFIIGEIGSIPIDCQGGESDFPADQPTGLADSSR